MFDDVSYMSFGVIVISVVELSMKVVFLSISEKQFSVFHQLLQFVQGSGSAKELAK